MIRWWAATLVLIATASSIFAQDNEQIDALKRRVKLDPEERLKDPLELERDEDAASKTAAFVANFSLPNSASGYASLSANLLGRIAFGAYDRALATYEQLLQNDVKLALPAGFEPLAAGSLLSGGLTSRDMHAVVQERLRRLPPSLLARYRTEIDADAARLLADGIATRNPVPLRKLVRDFRASAQADAALGLLGDLAFERGDFEQAIDRWRGIVPLPSHYLVNPQPRDGVDLPRIHAKQTLALVFAGRPDASGELAAYRALHPKERGTLAGRDDVYHAILTHWLDNSPTNADDESWPTFAGAASRNRIVGKAPHSRLWLDGAAWRAPLPKVDVKDRSAFLTATRSLSIPASPFHPIVADGQILLSDGYRVHSFDLLTGKPRFSAPADRGLVAGDESPSGLSFGLSAAPGRAFARLGKHPGDPQPRSLVCLDLRNSGKTLWSASAGLGSFDADPLAIGDRVYVSAVSREDHHATRLLHCFDLDGVPQWQTPLAVIQEAGDKLPRPGLLVAAGGLVVDATQSGLLIAVDVWTGRRAWAFRYPTIDASASIRGASSCLAADGRIYFAPADSQNLYCLDAETGQVQWERPWLKGPSDILAGPPMPSTIVDLLGVVENRLIFTDRNHLQALDARTGASLAWRHPDMGKLPSHGRGLLAGPWVFWPTADPEVSWRAVSQLRGALRHDVEPAEVARGGDKAAARVPDPEYYEPTILRNLPPGNIVFARGCLVVAGPSELVVYVPAARQLPGLEGDPDAKNVPAKLFRLAMAQLESGKADAAKATFGNLERCVPASQRNSWANLIKERLDPPSATKLIPPEKFEPQELPPSSTPVRVAASVANVKKLALAWGPIPGVAPPIERTPTTISDDVAVVLDGPDVAFASTTTGEELFRRRCRIGAVDWIGRNGGDLFVAGREGLEAFDLELRRPTWAFFAPAQTAARWRLVDDRPQRIVDSPRLNGFHFSECGLTFYEGQRRLFAANSGGRITELSHEYVIGLGDLPSGLPTWDWYASSQSPPGEDHPDGLAESRRRFVRLNARSWLRGDSHGVIALHDGVATSIEYRHPWPKSLTGAPAHVFGDASRLMALIPLNQGYELHRLTTANRPAPRLHPVWSIPPSELRDGFDVLETRFDETALYFIVGNQLQARRLTDGSLLWKRDLPSSPGRWKLERFGGGLIAWSQLHAGLPALSGPVDPFLAAVTLLHGRRGIGNVPIVFIDVKDGTVKQRIDVPHDRGPVFVNVAGPRLIVTAGGAVRCWSAN